MTRYDKKTEIMMKKHYTRLSEKDRRSYAAIEAYKLGHGGQKYICEVLGCSPILIMRGITELESDEEYESIRLSGGGAKKFIEKNENIMDTFWEILINHTAGDPMNDQILWTDLSVQDIVYQFKIKGFEVSEYIVGQLLKDNKFVKRKAKKEVELKEVENRNEQFLNIENLIEEYKATGDPIISIDVKKKEKIGNFYREGKLYGREATLVYDHDFSSDGDGVIIPHGIYDIMRNEAYITIGTSKDTSEFNCDCIEQWYENVGRINYPNARRILILADGGGSNSSRHYIFKQDLQELSNNTELIIRMAHYPPYTSKYNPIEHRVFCHITRACQGVVFKSIEIVNELINKTTTSTGLKVFSTILDKVYQTGRKYASDFKENMTIKFDSFLGNWNYVVMPNFDLEA